MSTTGLSFLFHFDNPAHTILEVKIPGLPDGTPKALVYHWVMFDKSRREVAELSFISMDNSPPEKIRSFTEGRLTFNEREAKFNPSNGGDAMHYEVLPSNDVPRDATTFILRFLDQKLRSAGLELPLAIRPLTP